MKEDTEATLSSRDCAAVEYAQWLIEVRGGLSHDHSQEYWRFSTKAELRGQVETGERFVQIIKEALAKKHGEVSIHFLPGLGKWNETLAAKLIADADRGDADADQVLREVAIEYLTKRIPLPNELADYAAACLQQANSNKAQAQKTESNSSKAHKTDYRDWILALTVDDVKRYFNLTHTRNRATETHCGCSIAALATKLSENTVQNAWHRYEGIADKRTWTNYAPQAMVFLTSDPTRSILVSFPRVGSTETMPRRQRRRASAPKK